ncbi:uncharacterized protein LOC112638589 [Camponotus floridanus]|uniref:uncharacterized protein LOC112638589 n=1 Tax=Camponotus floridanus TaxID=104421 RepID=UPI000DC670C4|nr:uncharacterized protein LOC112638589 [Camponotus floridanus]
MKCESAEELGRIHNAVTTAVNAQESIGRPVDSHGMDLLNFLTIELFDSRTRMEWESSISDSTDPPDHDTLVNFIAKRILTLNAAKPRVSSRTAESAPRTAKAHHSKTGSDYSKCALCQGKHTLMVCGDFKAKSASDRKSFVEQNRLCYNCLGNHLVSKCQSVKTCFTCKGKHHSTLHDAYSSSSSNEVSALAAMHSSSERKAILLATARLLIADRAGHLHPARAMLDQGSEVSIVSEALVQRLKLPRTSSSVSIIGIGGARSGSTRGRVALNLSSTATGTKLKAVAFVLPRLSAYQGSSVTNLSSWPHVRGLELADPRYQERDPVEILLGAEVCSTILEAGLRKGGPREPVAQKTALGWILSGGSSSASFQGPRSSLQCTVDPELNKLVHSFWEQEKEFPPPVALTPEEEQCETLFTRTYQRTASGRYVVRLPFSSSPTSLGETRKSAERLLNAMDLRSKRDPEFGAKYREFMQEYEDLEHMSPVSTTSTAACYLPHHGVLRQSNFGSKLRVVFNGSQRITSGDSLNSHLMVGANLLPALADILLRWRRHRFVIVTDIEKMFRQILVHPEDRRFQRILWRPRVSEKTQEYELNTVTYGLACAPFLAVRTLRQLATDEEARGPRGALALRHDCYMDDVITGADSLPHAVALQTELRELCTAGGFPLRKWAANSEAILVEGVPSDHRLQLAHHSWENEVHSTLGLRWHPASDDFSFTIQAPVTGGYTKRRVLSETARLFDPLGWLAPVIIRAKILIQSAWLKGLDWDTPLPTEDAQSWQRLLSELHVLGRLRVERWLGTTHQASQIEIHGFADASERGFAAVVYLRVTTADGTATHLLAAKTKVAPIKPVTLPRLELCAASLLANLTCHLWTSLDIPSAPVYLWSDSRVALHWIKGHASRWKTYVANRVSLIQQRLPEAQWRHVPGQDNPADCASRGIAPRDLLDHPLWWSGPDWLPRDSSLWPDQDNQTMMGEVPEIKGTILVATCRDKPEPKLLLQFSSLHRLLRVSAWCLRWRPSGRHPLSAVLLPSELDVSLFRWLRVVQGIHYAAEIAAARESRSMPKGGHLAKLHPFIDSQGILRVGGRLKHAILTYDERHPMIAPPASWLTQLIVESCHRRTLHGGTQLTLGLLRLRFWVPRGRAVVKRILHRCVTCVRWRANTPRPLMGDLPPGRVTPARPFLRTGVDYAGPIFLRTSKGRGQRAHKAFIALFVCLCSRATHLEVVSDYSTDAFLAAFRRFISRRGLCEEMYSDCGTNFVGADRQLREFFRASSPDGRRIAQGITKEGVSWRFNPPAAPHFGGLWEAAVKSTKHHLRRVIGESTLTFEEMSTLLAQIEACLNSRPLQALSDDPDDLSALTPGHLLIGAPLLAVPEPSLADQSPNTLSRWQLLQQMRDHFWQRWSQEYLHALAPRSKWLKAEPAPEVGALCLIRSESTSPTHWPLARITQLHPESDGTVRVVTVRTSTSEFVRPVVKLVLLPGVKETHASANE